MSTAPALKTAFDKYETAVKKMPTAWQNVGRASSATKTNFGIYRAEFGRDLNIPGPSHFAEGGIVTKPTMAIVGEFGPEAIIPLAAGLISGDRDATARPTRSGATKVC